MASKKNNRITHIALAALAGGATAGLLTLGVARHLVEELIRLHPLETNELYNFSPFETQVEYEDVSFATVNERTLAGWWLPRPETNRVIITVNGYRGKKEDMLGISSVLWRNGYNVLLFDYRAYGVKRNEGDLLTLGHRELEDLQAAIAYVKNRLNNPNIGLLGGSMGASIALVAAARDPKIQAVWADSPFTSQRDIIASVWRKATHLPTMPIVNVAERYFQVRTGHRWLDFAPIEEIGKIAPRPIFIVHGAKDSLVPVDSAYRLYAAAGWSKELWIDDESEHCGVYFAHRNEYAQKTLKFFSEHLKESDATLSSQKLVEA